MSDVERQQGLEQIGSTRIEQAPNDLTFGPPIAPSSTSEAETQTRPRSLQGLNDSSAGTLKAYMASAIDGLLVPQVIHSRSPILWVVDEAGTLLFALEEVVNLSDGTYMYPLPRGIRPPTGYAKLGHPALLGGGRGRIGGELNFDASESPGKWVLTNKSGRYGLVPDRTEAHLRNVAGICGKHGITVEVKFIDPPQL